MTRRRTNLRATFKNSTHPAINCLRVLLRAGRNFSVPAPRILARPFATLLSILRNMARWTWRVFVCEPFFKGLCSSHGRRLKTGHFLHFVSGKGDIIVGEDVVIIGKCNFMFAAVLPNVPVLEIGSNTFINHNCAFVIAERISVGSNVFIAGDVLLLDSPGHPMERTERSRGAPPHRSQIKPIAIQDDVWIGTGVRIMPGVTVGAGAVIAVGAIVTKDVAPNTFVGGSPAELIRKLEE